MVLQFTHHHHHQIFIISCQTATKYNKRVNNNITVRLVHIFKNHSVYEVSSVCVSYCILSLSYYNKIC